MPRARPGLATAVVARPRPSTAASKAENFRALGLVAERAGVGSPQERAMVLASCATAAVLPAVPALWCREGADSWDEMSLATMLWAAAALVEQGSLSSLDNQDNRAISDFDPVLHALEKQQNSDIDCNNAVYTR